MTQPLGAGLSTIYPVIKDNSDPKTNSLPEQPNPVSFFKNSKDLKNFTLAGLNNDLVKSKEKILNNFAKVPFSSAQGKYLAEALNQMHDIMYSSSKTNATQTEITNKISQCLTTLYQNFYLLRLIEVKSFANPPILSETETKNLQQFCRDAISSFFILNIHRSDLKKSSHTSVWFHTSSSTKMDNIFKKCNSKTNTNQYFKLGKSNQTVKQAGFPCAHGEYITVDNFKTLLINQTLDDKCPTDQPTEKTLVTTSGLGYQVNEIGYTIGSFKKGVLSAGPGLSYTKPSDDNEKHTFIEGEFKDALNLHEKNRKKTVVKQQGDKRITTMSQNFEKGKAALIEKYTSKASEKVHDVESLFANCTYNVKDLKLEIGTFPVEKLPSYIPLNSVYTGEIHVINGVKYLDGAGTITFPNGVHYQAKFEKNKMVGEVNGSFVQPQNYFSKAEINFIFDIDTEEKVTRIRKKDDQNITWSILKQDDIEYFWKKPWIFCMLGAKKDGKKNNAVNMLLTKEINIFYNDYSFCYPEGSKYSGELMVKDDNEYLHGEGTITFPNGRTYEGMFDYNRMIGNITCCYTTVEKKRVISSFNIDATGTIRDVTATHKNESYKELEWPKDFLKNPSYIINQLD